MFLSSLLNKKVSSISNPWELWRPFYKYTWAVVQRSSYRHFSRYTQSISSQLILDLGTGTGEYISRVGHANYYIFSDLDPAALRIAASRAQSHLPVASWNIMHGDALQLVRAAPAADIVSVIHIISVVPDPNALIAAALLNLKPGGILLIYISRFSRHCRHICNPFFQALGFRLLDIENMLPAFTRESAGWFNDCYIVKKDASP
jgi:phosphatidylethanolamine/phosphatidyl-N-methylethanolamine N-methyltransferase